MAVSVKAIRESLITQLIQNGANVAHYQDRIDDYIFTFTQLKKAQASVRKNGFTIKATSATGKEYDKDNPAIKQAVLLSKQKDEILRSMGLTAEKCINDEDDEL